MSDAAVGFCIVGMGMGLVRGREVLKTPGAKLISVVDIDADRASKAAAELGCRAHTSTREALKDPSVDFVMVMTPSGLHAPIAIEALEAGKHVVTTKPMEVSLEKCDLMIAASKKAGKMLGVDFQERYTPATQQIKYAIDSGLLGKPILAEARLKWFRNQEYYDQGGWRGTWKMDGGGALANQSVHLIDLLTWIMGRPSRVIGRTYTLNHRIETEDLGMAMLEYPSGAVGSILGTTTVPKGDWWGLEIHGSEGGVVAFLGKEYQWRFLDTCADRNQKLKTLFPHRNIFEDAVS